MSQYSKDDSFKEPPVLMLEAISMRKVNRPLAILMHNWLNLTNPQSKKINSPISVLSFLLDPVDRLPGLGKARIDFQDL